MSIAEIKRTADSLSARDRQWLRTYLMVKEQSESPDWKAKMGGRLRKLQAGEGISDAEYRRNAKSLKKSR
ncbi:MAG: hypothetical protein LBK99_08375 [Opitutaceae bacterium]|jgi:hypothetical protein|nr:hypothetical protein [Opitutaceae bacterium]